MRNSDVSYDKVDGKHNPSDLLTKALDAATMERHLETMGVMSLQGRAEAAPKCKRHEEYSNIRLIRGDEDQGEFVPPQTPLELTLVHSDSGGGRRRAGGGFANYVINEPRNIELIQKGNRNR